MNARPGAGSGLAGLLRSFTPALLSCAFLVAILAVPARAAGETTTIGFDDLADETLVSDQYAGKGLELGTAIGFGQKELSAGDCGSPTVKEGTSFSPPKYALLAACAVKGDPAAPLWSGTYGKLLGQPRGSVSVEMRDIAPAPPPRTAVLTGYDSAGNVVGSQEKTLAVGAWTQLAIALPGGAKTISYLSIAAKESNSEPIAIDDLSFETEAASTPHPPPPPPPPPAKPPVASIASLTPSPQPGSAISLTGAASQPGSGHIISYDWDLNGDGKIDTSTGTNPVVQLILAPGVHTVDLTVTNSNKETSKSSFGINVPLNTNTLHAPDGGEGECTSTYDQGNIHLIAECIQKQKGGGVVISSRQIALNGMDLTTTSGGPGVFKIETIKLLGIGNTVQLSGAAVNVELLNTPIGNVVLGGRDLEKEPITLAFEAFHPPTFKFPSAGFGDPRASASDAHAHAAGGGKTLVMAFAVAHKCAGGSKKAGCCPPQNNTSCAELPGSFPLTGQVAVYLNDKGQSLIDVQVGLELKSVNFEATGALEIIADRETGIDLESMKFEIGEAGLAEIFKVSKASFTYYFPSDPEESKRDSWQAKGTISFGPLESPAMEGELSFKKGEFHSASMVFTAPPGAGAPIYPGVEVNKIGASVGVNPLAFGGVLGAAIATQLELTLEFKFREATSTELGFFGGQGKLSYKDDDIATLAADVYSDGYTDAKLAVDIHFPFDSKEPAVEVGGGISFWDESASGLWQAEGEAHIKIWVISAEAAVLFNNQYIAGCLAAGEFGVQGRYRISDGNIDGGFFGLKKCSDELKQYKQKPLVKHSGGFVGGEDFLRSLPTTGAPWLTTAGAPAAAGPSARAAAGESQGFALPAGTTGQELRIGFAGAAPVVHIKGPGGQLFTTPATPGQFVTVGSEFIAAIGPGGHEVIVFLRKPKGGEWQLQAAGGTPIAKLETAQDIPPATIKATVKHKRGSRFALSYKIANLVPGTHVRFVERGRDSTHLLGVVGVARGTLAFTPQEGLSRPRTIVAYLFNAEGTPRRELTVARYSAPGAVHGGRVRKVRFVRHGSTGTITWSDAAGVRAYRIKVRGGDGRVQTLIRKPSVRSVTVTGLIPTDSYTAVVVARAGRNLLPGPKASATLKALKEPKPAPVKGKKKKKKG